MPDKLSDLDIKINTLITGKQRSFRRIQQLYDLAKKAEHNLKELDELRVRVNDLDTIRALFEKQVDEISALEQKRNPQFVINDQEINALDDLYFAIKNIFRNHESNQKYPRGDEDGGKTSRPAKPRLPKIELIKFDGQLHNWATFRDTFTNLIHNNNDIGNTEKFHYLLSVVSGPALQIAKSLRVSSDNYNIIWSALTDRFENKRALATNYLDQLFAFKPLSSESVNGLNSFLATFQDCVQALELLKIDDLSGFILCYIGLQNLDPVSRREFEKTIGQNDIPTFKSLINFVMQHSHILTMVTNTRSKPGTSKPTNNNCSSKPNAKNVNVKTCLTSNTGTNQSNNSKKACAYCNMSNHSIYKCFKYIDLTPTQRIDKIKELQLCYNCLRQGHASNECTSKITCTVCKNKHHHTLHLDSNLNSTLVAVNNTDTSVEQAKQVSLTCSTGSTVILGTAIVHVLDGLGIYQPVRVVIDSGSQSSFITSDCAQRLGLPRSKCNTQLVGLGGTLVHDQGMVSCRIKPTITNDPLFNIKAVVIPKISGDMPFATFSKEIIKEYQNLVLADPTFYRSSRIDILLGSDVFPFVYDGGKYHPSRQGLPLALSSVFGYIVTGQLSFNNYNTDNVKTCMFSGNSVKLDELVKSFWETENLTCDLPKDPNDVIVEQMYLSDCKRDSTGRYIVSYPFKPDASLGDSKQIALKRFENLERKLSRLPELRCEYKKFMDEYASLGHMVCVGNVADVESNYVIPHHCVHKPDSSSTKLRVVFDASCQTTNQESLNSILYTGPKLQSDLIELIIRFRLREICLCADISKMYRCILINENQRKFQHILWRDSMNEPIKVYELRTVTYGVISSPYLAIRTLQQLAIDEGSRFPNAARALREGFYIDDLLWSVDNVEEAFQIQHQLVELLKLGGFELRKWSSNSDQVLNSLPNDQLEPPVQFDDGKTMAIKILGLHWIPKEDAFSFRTTDTDINVTKRSVLSTIAKLFDPLGYVQPCIFLAKCFLQKLWRAKLDWGETLPSDLRDEWLAYSSQIPLLSKLKHDRHVFIKNYTAFQIVGFCDASMLGIAAVIFIRSQDAQGNIKVSLLLSKSKVSPLKTVSIPRLELMAAHLLSKSLNYVISILSKEVLISDVLAFTDSSVVLTWINTPAFKLKTFVANRVVKITENPSNIQWYHVNGSDNPADVCSRGATPAQLLQLADRWFRGPQWLYEPHHTWPVRSVSEFNGEPLESKSIKENASLLSESSTLKSDFDVISKVSSFIKLQRIVAWCFRFINNSRTRELNRIKGVLLTSELNNAHDKIIAIVQSQYFSDSIESIKRGKPCSQSLRKLDPFIDARGLLMVGGRLSHADLPYTQRHPLILPKKSHFTNILIDYYHKLYLHAGPRNLQNILAQRYWIIAARCIIRSRLSKCITCFKNRPTINQPKMASLPKYRLQDIYPFHTVGVDIGGPFYTKECNRRNAKISKSYLCLFVCYSTRAVHLEALSALTSECFLASFDRFTARRGLPHTVWSDNGKNFVASRKYFNEVFQFYNSNENKLTEGLTVRKVTWKLNPPIGSHFGGIFEAGIKSAKYHLKRVMGTRSLSFEELTTLLSNIEAILNSRPLCSLSNDPCEFDVLTPGHFLVGRQLVSAPSYDLSDVSINRLTRWQCIQQATTHFWRRWKREYLHTLQQRQKWFVDTPELAINDLVLVHNDNIPCQQWSLGRIEQTHPGTDGRVRVVTIRTQHSRFQRPVTKLSPLPKGQEI